MEIGETISMPETPEQSEDEQCPFEHNPPPDDATKNVLGGVGSVLGGNMDKGTGVGVHSHDKGTKEPDPRTAGVKSVFITVIGEVIELEGKPLPYPVTCAAHHLIPAQEALKGHPILKFMCKKGESQDFLDGKNAAPSAVSGSLVWGNVGYNVNGCHNGVWLPGNYAVGGGKGAVEIWKKRTSDKRKLSKDVAARLWAAKVDLSESEWGPDGDDEENEGPQPGESLEAALRSAQFRQYALVGTNHEIDEGNPKWAYVKAAMDKACGQFHDRHEPYSEEVKKYLQKVFDAYNKMYKRSKRQKRPCKQCEDAERPAGAPKDADLVGPPRQLIARLVRCSEFFRRHLAPEEQLLTVNIYTSDWQRAWFEPRLVSPRNP